MVDSSVWIDAFRGAATKEVAALRSLIGAEEILVGDIILCEVLQGVPSEAQAKLVENALRQFTITQMLNADLAIKAAANYRLLRSLGRTVRKTIDLVIGTFCIENGHVLLHADRDFEPIRQHLGLQTAPL